MHIYKWTHKESGKCYVGQSIQELNKVIGDHRVWLDKEAAV